MTGTLFIVLYQFFVTVNLIVAIHSALAIFFSKLSNKLLSGDDFDGMFDIKPPDEKMLTCPQSEALESFKAIYCKWYDSVKSKSSKDMQGFYYGGVFLSILSIVVMTSLFFNFYDAGLVSKIAIWGICTSFIVPYFYWIILFFVLSTKAKPVYDALIVHIDNINERNDYLTNSEQFKGLNDDVDCLIEFLTWGDNLAERVKVLFPDNKYKKQACPHCPHHRSVGTI